MAPSISIGHKRLSAADPPFIVAEVSANHGGSLQRALDLVSRCAESGADAVKLQTYTPDTMTLPLSNGDFYIDEGPWKGRSLYDLYEEAHTPWDWHGPLFERAREAGVLMFSTPFDASSVELLEDLGAPAYKIASFELVDLPLIKVVAGTGKPLIMSTGMASKNEIMAAVEVARENGAEQIALLHCVSAYPAPVAESNLFRIRTLHEDFRVVVGLSDHTQGSSAACAAVSLGAALVEKHVTLDRSVGGPDSAFSAEPAEFAELVKACKTAHEMLGDGTYSVQPAESESLRFRRSLYVVVDVEAGGVLDTNNVRSIRPGFGLPPGDLEAVVGKRAARDLPKGHALRWEDIEGERS